VPGAGRRVHRFNQQVVDVGLFPILGDRTLDEHGDTKIGHNEAASRDIEKILVPKSPLLKMRY